MKRIGYRIGDGLGKNGLSGTGRAAKNIIQSVCGLQEFFCMLLEQDVCGIQIPFDISYPEKTKGLPLQCMMNDIHLVHSLCEACFDEKGRFAKVMTIHDLIPLVHSEWFHVDSSWKDKFMQSARNADKIAADSECTKKDIVEHFKIQPEKIDVVYLGVDCGLESSKNRGEDFKEAVLQKYQLEQEYLLSVCTLEPRKNLVRLIGGFEHFKEHHKDSALKLVIVGRKGWLMNEIASYVCNADILKDIVVTGYVSDEELAGLYMGCMAVAYVSLYEGFGLPVLEGMSYAKPVITSNVTSIPEVGGDAVIYCNPYDVDSIEEGITQAAENQIDLEQLCQRAKQRAAGFTYERTARQLAGIYRTLIG